MTSEIIRLEEKTKWAKELPNQRKKFARGTDAKGWPGTALMRAAIKFSEEEGHVFLRRRMAE